MNHNKIIIENFKALKGKHEFEIRPLTMLIGPNNSGKSSITKAMDFLKFLAEQKFDEHFKLFNYNFENLEFKSRFGSLEQLLHKGESNFSIGFIENNYQEYLIYTFKLSENEKLKKIELEYYEFGKIGENGIKVMDARVYKFKKLIDSELYFGNKIDNILNGNEYIINERNYNLNNGNIIQLFKELGIDNHAQMGKLSFDILKDAYCHEIYLNSMLQNTSSNNNRLESSQFNYSTFKCNPRDLFTNLLDVTYSIDELIVLISLEIINFRTVLFFKNFSKLINENKVVTSFRNKDIYLLYLNNFYNCFGSSIEVEKYDLQFNLFYNIFDVIVKQDSLLLKNENDVNSCKAINIPLLIQEAKCNPLLEKSELLSYSHSSNSIFEILSSNNPKTKIAEIDWDQVFENIIKRPDIEIDSDIILDFIAEMIEELNVEKLIKKIVTSYFPKMANDNIINLEKLVSFWFGNFDYAILKYSYENNDFILNDNDNEYNNACLERMELSTEFKILTLKEKNKKHLTDVNEYINTRNVRSNNLSAKKYFDVEDTSTFNQLIKDFSKLDKTLQLNIIDKINNWLSKFGIGDKFEIEFNKEYETFNLYITDEKNNTKRKHNEFGAGVSQSLQLIFYCQMLQHEDVISNFGNSKSILIFEEPELYLHPALQSKLGELFYNTFEGKRYEDEEIIEETGGGFRVLPTIHKSYFDKMTIIETHSEYIVRKIQLLVAQEQGFFKDDIIIHYLNVSKESEKTFPIFITKDGRLTRDFGTGFFDEADNIATELFLLRNSQQN